MSDIEHKNNIVYFSRSAIAGVIVSPLLVVASAFSAVNSVFSETTIIDGILEPYAEAVVECGSMPNAIRDDASVASMVGSATGLALGSLLTVAGAFSVVSANGDVEPTSANENSQETHQLQGNCAEVDIEKQCSGSYQMKLPNGRHLTSAIN